jgi:DNA-binding transcriptional MocR family regulator
MPKYAQVASSIRTQIADGTLASGQPAPSGAALARATGYSTATCRRALRTLIKDGLLVPGTSPNARPRVPCSATGPEQARASAARALSAALRSHRRAAGLTQQQLAVLAGVSVTTVGHAEAAYGSPATSGNVRTRNSTPAGNCLPGTMLIALLPPPFPAPLTRTRRLPGPPHPPVSPKPKPLSPALCA